MPGRGLLPFLTIAVLLVLPECRASEGLSLPDPTPFEPEVVAKVHEIRDLAAEVRELEPNEETSEGTVHREILREYYEESEALAREEGDVETEAFNVAWQLLHLIGPEEDLLELSTSMMSSEVAGLYCLEEDKLFLVTGDELDLDFEAELTLAHEYVHSFQNAAFDFDRLYDMVEEEAEEKHNTEYCVTLDALMEGDATLSAIAYVGEKLGYQGFVDWLDDPDDSSTEPSESYRTALERYFDFPYSHGSYFVLHLWAKGGWEEVNKAYADPPSTTEQILHPEKYFDGEQADALVLPDLSDTLGEEWEQIDDAVFGEFDVYNYLVTSLGYDRGGDRASGLAAEGWGGGRIAIYANEEEDRALVHLLITWDSTDDAIEFLVAYMGVIGNLSHGAYSEDADEQQHTLMWDGEGEHVHAWLEGKAFNMLVGTERDDVVSVLTAMEPEAAEHFWGDTIPSVSPP